MDIRTCPVGVHGEPGQRGIPDVEQYGGRRGEFWTAERAIAARLGRVGRVVYWPSSLSELVCRK